MTPWSRATPRPAANRASRCSSPARSNRPTLVLKPTFNRRLTISFSLEGVGSGSGLLDLTREDPDDTSLGAELLDEIYPGGDAKSGESGVGSASGIFVEASAGGSGSADASGPSGLENIASTPAPVMIADVAEGFDPTAGAFGGLAFASVLISIVSGLIALAFYWGITPDWLASLIKGGMTNVLIFGIVLFVISAIFGMARASSPGQVGTDNPPVSSRRFKWLPKSGAFFLALPATASPSRGVRCGRRCAWP